MYQKIRSIILAFLILFLGVQVVNLAAQDQNRNKNAWPDPLPTLELSGKVIIDESHVNIYFLDGGTMYK